MIRSSSPACVAEATLAALCAGTAGRRGEGPIGSEKIFLCDLCASAVSLVLKSPPLRNIEDLPPFFQNLPLHLMIHFDDGGEGTQSLVRTAGIDDCPGTEPSVLLGQDGI